MSKKKYKRTIEELREVASMFWPEELSKKEAELSIIPKLIETQSHFIAILSVPLVDHDNIFQVLNYSNLPPNLFLKHLVILADIGGEQLMRINSQFDRLFPGGSLRYYFEGKLIDYNFKQLPIKGSLNNNKIGISGKKLLEIKPFDNLSEDVAKILLFGSACEDAETAAILSKCEVGNYIGKPDELATFVRQRYIWVSRITSGAQSNSLGQIAENYVKEYLKENIGINGLEIGSGYVPCVLERMNRQTKFDIVITNKSKYAAIEVSFQVTTNSVIERKAGQAQSRFEQMEKAGFMLAYVVDGAGNLNQRVNAVRAICSNSHCTVAFSKQELAVLCEFLKDYFRN